MSDKKKADPTPPAAPARKPSKDELAHYTAVHNSTELHKTIRSGFWALATVGAAWMCYRSVDTMAGRSTDFKSAIDWVVRVNLSEYVAYGVAALAGGGWYREHRARRRLVEDSGNRTAELEKIIDPARTGTGLNRDGTNPPGDLP